MILLYIIISKVKDCQKINYDEDEKSMGTYINVISEAVYFMTSLDRFFDTCYSRIYTPCEVTFHCMEVSFSVSK